MKKVYLLLISLVALLSSCTIDPIAKKTFDSALIVGKWQTAQEYWVYEAAGFGHTWDESDDVTEAEAQQFLWEIEGNALHITHIGEMGEQIPKDYTLTELSSTTLAYKDSYGKSFSFTKCSY